MEFCCVVLRGGNGQGPFQLKLFFVDQGGWAQGAKEEGRESLKKC